MLEHEMETPNQHVEAELETAYAAGWRHYDADYNPEYYKPQYFEDL